MIFINKTMGFQRNIREIFSSDNKLSSKRVITFIAFLLVSGAFLAELIFSIKIDSVTFNGMIQIVFAGLGVTVGEHLLRKNNGTYGSWKNGNGEPIDLNEGEEVDPENPPLGDN